MTSNPAVQKFDARVEETNSLLCVGLDSNIKKLPPKFSQSQTPQLDFNKYIIDEVAEYAASFKFNIAFYEARGDIGIKELKASVDYLKNSHPEAFIILDAKRADIGSTNEGYVDFVFDWLGADAITLHPYLGREALEPFLGRKDKVSIILAHTSNPGADEFQGLDVGGRPLWLQVVEQVDRDWNGNENCMVVLGATYPAELGQAREIAPDMTFLVPGVGAQGGDVEKTVTLGQRSDGRGLIINSSRGIIFAEKPKEEAQKLRDEINNYRHS